MQDLCREGKRTRTRGTERLIANGYLGGEPADFACEVATVDKRYLIDRNR